MTMLVSENTPPVYAIRCSFRYYLDSYLGSPLAGVFASVFAWQSAFLTSGIFLFIMALSCFASLLFLEKKGVIKHNRFEKQEAPNAKGSIKVLIKRRIIVFSIISVLTGVVRTTVVFWLPTYFNEYLGYSATESASIFTIATLAIALTVFVTMAIYELFKRNMDLTTRMMFIFASLFFLCAFLISHPVLNIIFIVLAILGSNAAANVLWSIYCPSLRDTGMVSTATGFLTFIGYMGSSASSYIFAYMVDATGWKTVVFVWFALMVLGVIITLPYGKILKKRS